MKMRTPGRHPGTSAPPLSLVHFSSHLLIPFLLLPPLLHQTPLRLSGVLTSGGDCFRRIAPRRGDTHLMALVPAPKD